MARADREAVLRGVNARFDEAGDDDAVIKELGSPTFAAVTVLRGYTPPEESDDEDYAPDESEYVAPSNQAETEPEPEVVEAAPEAEAEAEPAKAEPDAEYEIIENIEAVESEAKPIEAEPAADEAPEAEIVEEAPEASVDEVMDETEPEPEAETSEEPVEIPADEAASEPEPDEPAAEEIEAADAAPARTFDTVDIGFGTIEVYNDGTSEDESVSSAPASGQPVAVAEPEPADAPEEAEEAAEPEEAPEPSEPEAVDEAGKSDVDFDAIFGDKPAEEPVTEAKLRGGRVFLVALLTLIPGVPVAAVLAVVSLALLAVGAALIYTGGVIISFAFLGMSVAADIMLCAGAGLFVAALGLPVVFFAVWFFLRCFVRLYSRTFARAGEWCRGEVRK